MWDVDYIFSLASARGEKNNIIKIQNAFEEFDLGINACAIKPMN